MSVLQCLNIWLNVTSPLHSWRCCHPSDHGDVTDSHSSQNGPLPTDRWTVHAILSLLAPSKVCNSCIPIGLKTYKNQIASPDCLWDTFPYSWATHSLYCNQMNMVGHLSCSNCSLHQYLHCLSCSRTNERTCIWVDPTQHVADVVSLACRSWWLWLNIPLKVSKHLLKNPLLVGYVYPTPAEGGMEGLTH